MENVGIGAGLASLAFWIFIAAVVVGGIWDGIRKREAQHETIRRVIESGNDLDEKTMDRLVSLTGGESKRYDRDFKITALWILPVAVGMALFAVILGRQVPDALYVLLGVAALLASLGLGFLLCGKIAERWYEEDNN